MKKEQILEQIGSLIEKTQDIVILYGTRSEIDFNKRLITNNKGMFKNEPNQQYLEIERRKFPVLEMKEIVDEVFGSTIIHLNKDIGVKWVYPMPFVQKS